MADPGREDGCKGQGSLKGGWLRERELAGDDWPQREDYQPAETNIKTWCEVTPTLSHKCIEQAMKKEWLVVVLRHRSQRRRVATATSNEAIFHPLQRNSITKLTYNVRHSVIRTNFTETQFRSIHACSSHIHTMLFTCTYLAYHMYVSCLSNVHTLLHFMYGTHANSWSAEHHSQFDCVCGFRLHMCSVSLTRNLDSFYHDFKHLVHFWNKIYRLEVWKKLS